MSLFDQHPALQPPPPTAVEALATAVAIMARLRAPDGCPWDREQTFDSIKKHTLEEVYEVFDAIERRDFADLRDELGDLLLQVLFYAQMASDDGRFTIADVADALNAKLIRRHPHIFGNVDAEDAATVLRNWDAIKRDEKAAAGKASVSLLDDVPRSMPAMLEAHKLGSRAAKVGFDWPDADGLLEKVREETAELEVEMRAGRRVEVEEEFGDLLFTLANLARHLHIDAESALRSANRKFRTRFGSMEVEAGGALEGRSAADLEALWDAAKQAERATP